jgi:transposase InsO family protein
MSRLIALSQAYLPAIPGGRTGGSSQRKRIGLFERRPLPKPTRVDISWSMDFVADGLCNGRKLRCLTIVDDCSRESLVIEVDSSINGRRVAAVLDRLADLRGLPLSITVDHGPEFEGQVLDTWAYEHGVRLTSSGPENRSRTRAGRYFEDDPIGLEGGGSRFTAWPNPQKPNVWRRPANLSSTACVGLRNPESNSGRHRASSALTR